MATVRLPHITALWFVPYHILYSLLWSMGTEQNTFSINRQKFPPNCHLKGLYFITEKLPVLTDTSAWHAEVDWTTARGAWHGSMIKHEWSCDNHALILTSHNQRVPISQLVRHFGITHKASRIHGCVAVYNQGFRWGNWPVESKRCRW